MLQVLVLDFKILVLILTLADYFFLSVFFFTNKLTLLRLTSHQYRKDDDENYYEEYDDKYEKSLSLNRPAMIKPFYWTQNIITEFTITEQFEGYLSLREKLQSVR